jgi:hypothetical protein
MRPNEGPLLLPPFLKDNDLLSVYSEKCSQDHRPEMIMQIKHVVKVTVPEKRFAK